MQRLIQMQTCLGGGARRIASTAFPTLLSLRGSTLAHLRLRLAWSASSAALPREGRMHDNLRSAMDDGTLQLALFAAHNTE